MAIEGEKSESRLGRLEVGDGRCVLRFERRLPHPMEKVWRAITEPEHLTHWYPVKRALVPEVGGDVREGDIDLPDGIVAHGTVTAYDPPRLVEYTLATETIPMAGFGDLRTSRFELSPDPMGCRLVFVHTFDDRSGAASYSSGWQVCLDALEAVLDERPIADFDGWTERHEAYVARFRLAEGAVSEYAAGWVVRFERQLMGHSVEKVWGLLTEAGASVEADTTAAGLVVGGAPPARFTNGYVPRAEITAVEAPTLLEYGWRDRSHPGDDRGAPESAVRNVVEKVSESAVRNVVENAAESVVDGVNGVVGRVRWELAAGPGGARVTLTQTVPARLADHLPTALAAWHVQVESLAQHSAGDRPCWPEGRVEELREFYAGRLAGGV